MCTTHVTLNTILEPFDDLKNKLASIDTTRTAKSKLSSHCGDTRALEHVGCKAGESSVAKNESGSEGR